MFLKYQNKKIILKTTYQNKVFGFLFLKSV